MRRSGLSIDDILKGLSRPRSRYLTVKKTLQRRVQDEQLVRLDRGRYAASRDALQGEMAFPCPVSLETPGAPGDIAPVPILGFDRKGVNTLGDRGQQIFGQTGNVSTLSPMFVQAGGKDA